VRLRDPQKLTLPTPIMAAGDRTQIVAALAQMAAALAAQPAPSASRPPPTSPGSRRSDSRAPAERPLPLRSVGASPGFRAAPGSPSPGRLHLRPSNSLFSKGESVYRPRAGRVEQVVHSLIQVKRGVSTETQQPGKQGGGGLADARGGRHAQTVVIREGSPLARREEVIPMEKEPGKPQPGKPEPGKPQPGKPEPWKPEPGKPQPGPR
jgi:hypothetical protein